MKILWFTGLEFVRWYDSMGRTDVIKFSYENYGLNYVGKFDNSDKSYKFEIVDEKKYLEFLLRYR